MARDEQTTKPATGNAASDDAPMSDRANTIIALALIAIFLTWIGCAVAVWAGWAI